MSDPTLEHPVFVYGTLKKGFGNAALLRHSKRKGVFRTTQNNYYLDGAYMGAPMIAYVEGWDHIIGEVWEVDTKTLKRIDGLEGHPKFYQRKLVCIEDYGRAWMYMVRKNFIDAVIPKAWNRAWNIVWTSSQPGMKVLRWPLEGEDQEELERPRWGNPWWHESHKCPCAFREPLIPHPDKYESRCPCGQTWYGEFD